MRARDYARSIVEGETLAAKLSAPGDLVYEDSEPPLILTAPGRPPELAIVPGREAKVPPIEGMRDPHQRARILHALANHELQAIELFAWAVLAYPDAPMQFRRGLVAILVEEQRHFGLYVDRLTALKTAFSDHPVTGHFWGKLDQFATPLGFACAMGMTFEHANLDFCGDYMAAARACGDHATAAALEQVHTDEIKHVHFGWLWMKRFAGDRDPWDVYTEPIKPPLGPHRARGARMDLEARKRAGIDDAFIAKLDAIAAKRPSGASR